ncbi:MAG TPA: metal-sulfur cluster assembly factor [Chloroflexota bacterium]|nr:metal-sulfur cluster assembly factor [Chloroflexota bacterium]
MIETGSAVAGIWEALHDVTDPEFPISIVDMGLVVDVQSRAGKVDIKLTLTSMGCPALDMIVEDVRERVLREPGVEDVAVEIVWEPIWTKERLSEDGRMQLREWGIAV